MGKIVAEVEENVLTVNPNNIFKVIQPSTSEFAVIDQWGNESIRVRMLNSHAARVTGRFFVGPRSLVQISDSAFLFNGERLGTFCMHNVGNGFVID
jgi:hypothetical protein